MRCWIAHASCRYTGSETHPLLVAAWPLGRWKEMASMAVMLANAVRVPCANPKPSSFSPSYGGGDRGSPSVVECSSRPQKKATSHHMKTRPKKTQPWDIKRKGPTAYPPLPVLPPDWTLVSSVEPPPPPVEGDAPATASG
ncbi:50S ribosomal protein 6, chloroplastic [Zingiber officinale]|uniref:50S ribosomal protein 6, chloroplastic n=1 Tax=Zingiber officinale TaxID=94328 RepID=A0A8J5HDT8_ZINOF|nr:50S ribosomal protein 6, chloroplastic [Zingiber officinale]KAG6526071.1 hypothetical protein ZIOFF_016046 [Zingiber officinale]